MKYTLLAVLFNLSIWPALAQNKQWLRNIDSTGSRVYNLYSGNNPNQYFSLNWHQDFRGIVKNNLSYYRINRFDNDTLFGSVEVFNPEFGTGIFNLSMNVRTSRDALMHSRNFQTDTAVYYIVYFNDTLGKDSFNIQSPIKKGVGFCYLKQNDSLIIIHADDFIQGGNVYILFTDSQGRYLSHKRIPHENDNPSPVFNNIVMSPINMIADGKGGYVVVGERDSIGTNSKKHLFGLNAQGSKMWEYFEPMPGNSYLTGAKLMSDGTILTWGMQWERMYLGCFSNEGIPLWQKMYYPGSEIKGGLAIINDVQIIDGHFYIVGVSAENILGQNPYTCIGVFMKLTLQGEVVWAKGFGNYHDNNILQHMLFLPPNKFMLGGFCMDSTLNPVHGVGWYVSTDTAANEERPWCRLLPVSTLNYTALNHIKNPDCNNCLKVFPNPVTDGMLTIEIEPEFLDDAQLVMYTINGIPVHKQTQLQSSNTINTGQMAPGNYILWFKSNKGATTKKIMIR